MDFAIAFHMMVLSADTRCIVSLGRLIRIIKRVHSLTGLLGILTSRFPVYYTNGQGVSPPQKVVPSKQRCYQDKIVANYRNNAYLLLIACVFSLFPRQHESYLGQVLGGSDMTHLREHIMMLSHGTTQDIRLTRFFRSA